MCIRDRDNEVEEVKWIDIRKLNNYKWAFNHNKIIERIILLKQYIQKIRLSRWVIVSNGCSVCINSGKVSLKGINRHNLLYRRCLFWGCGYKKYPLCYTLRFDCRCCRYCSRTVNTRRHKAYRLLTELMGGEADD